MFFLEKDNHDVESLASIYIEIFKKTFDFEY